MRKTLSILFLLAVALCGQASAQLSQCAITATIYDNNGDLLSGARIVVVKVVKNGSLISNSPLVYTTNASGVATFNLPRSSVAWIWANSYGLNANGSAGVAVTVPAAASANLEELAAFSSVLTTLGDLAYGGASGVFTRLAGNTSSTAKFLCQQGNGTTSTAPGWCAFAGSGNLTLTYDNNARTATFGYAPSSSELLTALGSQSANRVLASPDGSSGAMSVRALVAADIPTGISAANIGGGAVSNTEFGYLDGVTSALQTQLDGKAATSHTHAQSDITNLVSDLALKAPLASPALTGNPTAPTQSANNNSTRLATTAYVDTAVAAVTVSELSQANAIDRASSTSGGFSGRRAFDAVDRWWGIKYATKSAHGFSVLDPIYNDSSGVWQKALATGASTLPTAIVTKIVDANTFEYASAEGEYTFTAHGLSTSNVYYLQDAGGLGTSAGTVSYIVGAPTSANLFQYYGVRGAGLSDGDKGDITISGGLASLTIDNLAVTNAKLAGSIAASKLVGTDIATVGTITAGTWNSTAISAQYGGTGQNFSASTGIPLITSGTWSALSTTGSGNVVRDTSPTLVTPALGAATATSLSVAGNVTLNTGGFIYGDTTTPFLRLNNAAGSTFGYGTANITIGGPIILNFAAGEAVRFQNISGYAGFGTAAPDTRIHGKLSSAATNAVSAVATIEHASTGTAAAGFGARLKLNLESSTTDNQDAASIEALWTTATHASRTGVLSFSTVSNAGSLTERVRVKEDGLQFAGVTFSALGSVNNTLTVCTDCALTSGADNTCTSGGSGALAARINGTWRCFINQN